jgi:hypothetical protein
MPMNKQEKENRSKKTPKKSKNNVLPPKTMRSSNPKTNQNYCQHYMFLLSLSLLSIDSQKNEKEKKEKQN